MPLQVTSLSEVDSTLVQDLQSQMSQLLQERFPEVELDRGVIHDVVTFLHSICAATNQQTINKVLQSRSLLAISQSPALADDTLVDHVLSNFRLLRKTGTQATGNIAIVVEGSATIVIAADTVFTCNGLIFRTTMPITARPPGVVTSAVNDRVLQPRGDGTYEFTVPAIGASVGEEYNLQTNSKFIPAVVQQRFVTAYAATDFTGGTSTDSNQTQINKLETGIAAPVTAGRLNMQSLITSQTQFAESKAISIVGFGDPEMTRDQHSIVPISSGGRIDVYYRATALPQIVSLQKTATLIEKRVTDSVWQFTITRDDAPGFYMVDAVRRLSDAKDIAGFHIVTDQRSIAIGNDAWYPDIAYIAEAAFTRYQSTVIRFVDSTTNASTLSVGDTVDYSVDMLTQADIRGLQEFLASSSYRCLGADVLVKSAIPCFVSVNCTVVKDSVETEPDVNAIKVALADFVNNLGFAGVVYESQITDIIHNYLSGTQAVSQLDMYGKLLMPDLSSKILRDNKRLQVPNMADQFVTKNTTVFILYPENISVTVVNRS